MLLHFIYYWVWWFKNDFCCKWHLPISILHILSSLVCDSLSVFIIYERAASLLRFFPSVACVLVFSFMLSFLTLNILHLFLYKQSLDCLYLKVFLLAFMTVTKFLFSILEFQCCSLSSSLNLQVWHKLKPYNVLIFLIN